MAGAAAAGDQLFYVGIGSMMHPKKWTRRNTTPLEAHPVRCLNFERRFWGKFGMAEVREKEGADFHAVLFRVSLADMKVLDEIERGYIRKDVVCERYDGTRVTGSAYQSTPC